MWGEDGPRTLLRQVSAPRSPGPGPRGGPPGFSLPPVSLPPLWATSFQKAPAPWPRAAAPALGLGLSLRGPVGCTRLCTTERPGPGRPAGRVPCSGGRPATPSLHPNQQAEVLVPGCPAGWGEDFAPVSLCHLVGAGEAAVSPQDAEAVATSVPATVPPCWAQPPRLRGSPSADTASSSSWRLQVTRSPECPPA